MKNWIKDSRAAAWLASFGIDVEYSEHVPLAEFMPDWQKCNPGRDGMSPTVDDLVLAYAEAMEAGKSFPAVILLKGPQGYQPLDGFQRCAAVGLNNGTHVAAFIIRHGAVMPQTVYIISRCANFILNGLQPPKEFQINQALRLVDENGLSPEEAASAIGLSKAQINRAINRRVVLKALNEHGVEASGQVNGVLDVIRPLVDLDAKMAAEVFKTHVAAGLHTDQTTELIKAVVKQNSRGERIKALTKFRSRPEIQSRLNNSGKRSVAPTDRLFSLLRGIKTFVTEHGDEVYLGTKEQQAELDRLTKWLDGRLRALLKNTHCKV